MMYWLVSFLFAAFLSATAIGLAYRCYPLQPLNVRFNTPHKLLNWFIVIYPPTYFILLLIFGNESTGPNTKDHMPSALIFITGHVILSTMATVLSIHLAKRHKANMIFVVANSLATLLYFTALTILLLLGLMSLKHNP